MRRFLLGFFALGAIIAVGGCSGGETVTATTYPTVDATSWVVLVSGSATPSPTSTYRSPSPSATAGAAHAATTTGPTTTPSATACADSEVDLKNINGATVTTTATTGTVTWYNPGGANLVEYRVTAISQDVANGQQRDVGWTVVTPTTSCGYLSATVTGLDSKTRYLFSVDAVTTRLGMEGTRAATVARSAVTATS
jgi:fibronectin type III domain protein